MLTTLIFWVQEHPLWLLSPPAACSFVLTSPFPLQDLSASSALCSQAVYLSPGRDPTWPGRCLCFCCGRGPPGAMQPGWEIRIPYCCIADILSHHLLGFCWGQLKSGTLCLHFSLSDDFKGAITTSVCFLQFKVYWRVFFFVAFVVSFRFSFPTSQTTRYRSNADSRNSLIFHNLLPCQIADFWQDEKGQNKFDSSSCNFSSAWWVYLCQVFQVAGTTDY